MKVRISENAFRFRLTIPDLNEWIEKRVCSLQMELPSENTLQFVLTLADQLTPRMEIRNGTHFYFFLNSTEFDNWSRNQDLISWKSELSRAAGASITLLIEKDFACGDPDDGSKSLFFERPKSEKPC